MYLLIMGTVSNTGSGGGGGGGTTAITGVKLKVTSTDATICTWTASGQSQDLDIGIGAGTLESNDVMLEVTMNWSGFSWSGTSQFNLPINAVEPPGTQYFMQAWDPGQPEPGEPDIKDSGAGYLTSDSYAKYFGSGYANGTFVVRFSSREPYTLENAGGLLGSPFNSFVLQPSSFDDGAGGLAPLVLQINNKVTDSSGSAVNASQWTITINPVGF